MLAETVQLTMVHRDPSVTDVLSNRVGAGFGVSISSRWRLGSPEFSVSNVKSSIAALLAVMVVIGLWTTSSDALNTRGLTSPGTLEAFWKLDESSGRVAEDSSGKQLHGRFNKEPNRASGVAGRAVWFDGAHDSIDFGHSSPLRLAGSMTISAWIKSTSYPVDDAAIVSSHNSSTTVAGYQLDTTVDRGPRTIGFKIANECGQLTARYGATPLVAGSWYHVAGVYDADRRTMDVYLNGQPDNGFLLGSVAGAQHASRFHVYVGRRSDLTGFEFAGFIDEVRIYSRALTNAEIVSDMRSRVIDGPAPEGAPGEDGGSQRTLTRYNNFHAPCAVSSDQEDAEIPAAAAGVGVLAAIACVGYWPSTAGIAYLLVSLAAGLLLLPLTASTLPSINLWLIPLTSLVGGISVVVSIRSSARS